MDLTINTELGKLNVRVAAVIIHNGKVLLEKSDNNDYYGFIGGRVKFGETAEQAIARELNEELGELSHIIRPLYVTQNLFEINGCKYHEIGFYFLAAVSQRLIDKNAFESNDGKNICYWLDIDKLSTVKVVPEYIASNLTNLPQSVELITIH